MADGPNYRVALKRRRSGRTNYYRRRGMLKSDEIRLVIRKSNNHILVQFVEAKPDGDITLAAVSTHHLKKYGWNITGGNIPASYLVGYLAGKKAVNADIEFAILDLGVQISQKGSRIYSCLKGVIDAGIEVPTADWIFPEDDVIKGSHIVKYSQKLKDDDVDAYKKTYAAYLAVNQPPEQLENHVNTCLEAINKEFK